MTLKELEIGKSAIIQTVGGEGALRQHILDMGLIPGAEVTMVKFAPMGDPMELRVHSYELTLRVADAEKIEIAPVKKAAKEPSLSQKKELAHPGLGEGGHYHNKADEHPLPDGTVLTFALAGNQNCGKTTLLYTPCVAAIASSSGSWAANGPSLWWWSSAPSRGSLRQWSG